MSISRYKSGLIIAVLLLFTLFVAFPELILRGWIPTNPSFRQLVHFFLHQFISLREPIVLGDDFYLNQQGFKRRFEFESKYLVGYRIIISDGEIKRRQEFGDVSRVQFYQGKLRITFYTGKERIGFVDIGKEWHAFFWPKGKEDVQIFLTLMMFELPLEGKYRNLSFEIEVLEPDYKFQKPVQVLFSRTTREPYKEFELKK